MIKYLLLLYEYLIVQGKGLAIKLVLPILVILSINRFDLGLDVTVINSYISSSINVLGILLGFTGSIFTLILTMNNPAIESSKNHKLPAKLYKTNFSIYDHLVISCGFLIFLLGFLLLVNFLLPIYYNLIATKYLLLFSINLGLIMFGIIQLVSSLLGFYFIVTKRD